MPPGQKWQEDEGAYEHCKIVKSASRFRAAYDIAPMRPRGLKRLTWAAYRHSGKLHLRDALQAAHYFKAVNLDLTVQVAAQMGFQPQIIVSCRPFAAYAFSLSQMYRHRDLAVLEADYIRTYRNALFLLQLYGGCVVTYETLSDTRHLDWLASLASVTDLLENKLRQAALALINNTHGRDHSIDLRCPQTDDLYRQISVLEGTVISSSRIARRSLARIESDGTL